MCADAHRGQQRAVDPLQLELEGSGEYTGGQRLKSHSLPWLCGSRDQTQSVKFGGKHPQFIFNYF